MMQHATLLERVRHRVASQFAQIGSTSPESACETILVRDGYYCGRRFESDGLAAVWFIQENELKFFDRSGALVQVLKPCIPDQPSIANVA